MASTSSLVQLDVRTGTGPLATTTACLASSFFFSSSTTAAALLFTTTDAFLPAAAAAGSSSALAALLGCGVIFLAFSSATLPGFFFDLVLASALGCFAGGGGFSWFFLLKQSPMVNGRKNS